MIEFLFNDGSHDDFLQRGDQDQPAVGVGFAAEGDLQLVVMAVPVGVVALAEDLEILVGGRAGLLSR